MGRVSTPYRLSSDLETQLPNLVASPPLLHSAPGGVHRDPSVPECDCLPCSEIGSNYGSLVRLDYTSLCRVRGCSYSLHNCWVNGKPWALHLEIHERSHYRDEGRYHCAEEDCHASFKRWHDLIRHSTDSHCKVAQRYPCSEPGCKYGGGNGFRRPDKLKSHVKMHQKNKPSGRMPTATGSRVMKQGQESGESSVASFAAGSHGKQIEARK